MSQSSGLPPPTHPEAQHFVLHERKQEAQEPEAGTAEDDEGAPDAAIDYLQAMAGFMGVVEAPKELDPEVQAEAAVAFLQTLWHDGDAEVRTSITSAPETLKTCLLALALGSMFQSSHRQRSQHSACPVQDQAEALMQTSAHITDADATTYESLAKSLADATFASARDPTGAPAGHASTTANAVAAEQTAQQALRIAQQEANTASSELAALRLQLDSLEGELAKVSTSSRPQPGRAAELQACAPKNTIHVTTLVDPNTLQHVLPQSAARRFGLVFLPR